METTEVPELLTLTDEVKRLSSIKLEAKLKSTTLLLGTTGELRVGVTLANNTVELHSLRIAEGHEGNSWLCVVLNFAEILLACWSSG